MYAIPGNLADWNLDIINDLLRYKDIESETFDFTESCNKLCDAICAMANVNGGQVIIGISEDRDKQKSRNLKGFIGKGFDKGQEDNVLKDIGNEVYKVEPTVKMEKPRIIPNGDKFYVVVKIPNNDSMKPYVLKDQGKILVRLGNSNKPASRTAMMGLFSTYLQKRSDVQQLRATLSLFRQLFENTTQKIALLSYDDKEHGLNISQLDIDLLKRGIVSSQWFLEKNDLLGGYNYNVDLTSQTYGLYPMLYELINLNTLIEQFNFRNEKTNISSLKSNLQSWGHYQGNYRKVLDQINKTIKICDTFIEQHNI